MKVLLINGSPNVNGSTYTALKEVESELHLSGIETIIHHIGSAPIPGCTGCRSCKSSGSCIFNDSVNDVIKLIKEVDGIVIGSPVYFASANGSLISFLDRLFYAGGDFSYKVGAAIAVARRAGTTATLDELNKYFLIRNMIVVGSQYWNLAHGNNAQEVILDLEGMQTMRTLGKNMAYVIKALKLSKESGLPLPKKEKVVHTNFIRTLDD